MEVFSKVVDILGIKSGDTYTVSQPDLQGFINICANGKIAAIAHTDCGVAILADSYYNPCTDPTAIIYRA